MTSNNDNAPAPAQPMKYFDIGIGRPVGVADPTADMLIKAYLGSFNAAWDEAQRERGAA